MGLHGMRYKGIVFDFNGVLFWDADLQVKSWQVIAKNLRGHQMKEEDGARKSFPRRSQVVQARLGRSCADFQQLWASVWVSR